MTGSKPYVSIVAHYESCLRRFGDCHLGVDWKDAQEADRRYQVMLDIMETPPGVTPTLLDFGCGTAGLYDFIQKQGIVFIEYIGLDVSPTFIAVCKQKHPHLKFLNIDILDQHEDLPQCDYIVLNGVFTEKIDLSFEQMFDYFCCMMQRLFPYATRGIAFNLRSTHVEKRYDELFHLPLDTLANFLTNRVSNNFIIRHDYGLDEYTVYLYPPRTLP
jgi:SAM-dependent methyltransferase